jgi:hypothetical protein
MEKQKLDNGLLLIAYLSNIFAPLGIMIYFGISYLNHPAQDDDLIFAGLIFGFSLVSFLMFFRFRKVEFDDEYVYVKSVFNRELDSFPIRNITGVKKMMFTFNSKNNRRGRSGKNYRITYTDNNGMIKKVRVMATISSNVVGNFQKATAFLGADGFNPE